MLVLILFLPWIRIVFTQTLTHSLNPIFFFSYTLLNSQYCKQSSGQSQEYQSHISGITLSPFVIGDVGWRKRKWLCWQSLLHWVVGRVKVCNISIFRQCTCLHTWLCVCVILRPKKFMVTCKKSGLYLKNSLRYWDLKILR